MRKWRESEDLIIAEFYQAKGTDYCVQLLDGRSSRAVIQRAIRLGVKGRRWTPREDSIIRLCYPALGSKYCRRYMPYRSIIAIQWRAGAIGVKRDLTKLNRRQVYPDDYVRSMEHAAAMGWVRKWW